MGTAVASFSRARLSGHDCLSCTHPSHDDLAPRHTCAPTQGLPRATRDSYTTAAVPPHDNSPNFHTGSLLFNGSSNNQLL